MGYRTAQGFFTENFKRSVVLEIESGERNIIEVNRTYEIRGHSTVMKWCRRYGGKHYPIMVQKQRKDTDITHDNEQIQLLRNQVRVLERDLQEARLKQATLETLIDIAEQHYSISIKKNTGGKQSNK